MMPRRNAVPGGEVPFLHEKQIEREADLLLAEYAEMIDPVLEPPVPVEELVGTAQLRQKFLDLKSLFPYGDVHGAIWFEDALIAIDFTLNPDTSPRRRGRYHFTLAHEIGHWRLHRKHFVATPNQGRLFDDGTRKPDVVCRSSESKMPVEWQADTFAAVLLMPRKMMYSAWTKFRGGDDRPVELRELHAARSGVEILYRGKLPASEEERDNAVKEDFCGPLAEQFEVSREAMRIRLESLELIVKKRPTTLF